MEYCCVGVIFLIAACCGLAGLTFALRQYNSRNKTEAKDADSV
jgi:hypothetical protein